MARQYRQAGPARQAAQSRQAGQSPQVRQTHQPRRKGAHFASPAASVSTQVSTPAPQRVEKPASSRASSAAPAVKESKRGKILCIVLGICCALVLSAGAVFAFWVNSLQSKLNDSAVVTQELRQSLSERKAPSEPYYALLLGTDGLPGETVYRADTIILARVNPIQKQLTLLSIPRDTRVTWKGSTMKINAVHAYDGAAGMVEIVSQICKVPIAHYAEVNFNGLIGITNAVGGVDLEVDCTIHDTENFHVVTHLDPGFQHLDGEQALFYTRARAFADGDYTRMRHQRTYIQALTQKVIGSYDPVMLVNLLNSISGMVITDLSVQEIVDLANEMRGTDFTNHFYTAHVPSEPKMIDGVSYVIADWPALEAIMVKIRAGQNPQAPQEKEAMGSSQETPSSRRKESTASTQTQSQ